MHVYQIKFKKSHEVDVEMPSKVEEQKCEPWVVSAVSRVVPSACVRVCARARARGRARVGLRACGRAGACVCVCVRVCVCARACGSRICVNLFWHGGVLDHGACSSTTSQPPSSLVPVRGGSRRAALTVIPIRTYQYGRLSTVPETLPPRTQDWCETRRRGPKQCGARKK